MNANILPAEFIQFPPATLSLSREEMSHLPDTNPAIYDADAFIAKWKSRIRSARSAQMPLPASPRASSHQPTNSNGSSRFDFLQRAKRETQGGSQGQENDKEGGLEDAPGDEDDDTYQQRPESGSVDQQFDHQEKMEQPPLRGSRRLLGLDASQTGGEGIDVDMEGN